MAKQFNPFHSWLGIEERLGVPTHFQLLGVKPKVDDRAAFQQQVEKQYNAVVTKLDGMSAEEIGSHSKLHMRVKAHVVKARQILLDDKLRADYIQGLRDKVRQKKASAKPAAASKSATSTKTTAGQHTSASASGSTAATTSTLPNTKTQKTNASIKQRPPAETPKQPVKARARTETVPMAIPVAKPIAKPILKPVAKTVAQKNVTPVARSTKVEGQRLPEPPPTPSEFNNPAASGTVRKPAPQTNDAEIVAEIDKLENEARSEAIRVRTVRKRRKKSFLMPVLIGGFLLLGIAGLSMLFSSSEYDLNLSGLTGSSDSTSTEEGSNEIASDEMHSLETGLGERSESSNENSTTTEGDFATEPKTSDVAPDVAPEEWPPAEIETPSETAMVPDSDMGSSTASPAVPDIDIGSLPKANETDVAMGSEPIVLESVDEPSIADDEPLDSEPVVLEDDPTPDMELASNNSESAKAFDDPFDAEAAVKDEAPVAVEPPVEVEPSIEVEPTVADTAVATETPAAEMKDPDFFAAKVVDFESAEFLITRARAEMKRGRTDSAAEQFVLAETVLNNAKDKVNPTTEQQIADGQKALAAVDGFWNHVAKSARSYSGDSLTPAPGVQIGLVEARQGDVVLKIGGELVSIPYRSLRPGLAMELASKTKPDDPAQWLLQQAAFRTIHSSGSPKSIQAIEDLLTQGDAAGLSTEALRRFWKSSSALNEVDLAQKQKYTPKDLKPLVGQIVAGKYSSVRRVDPETAGSLATELSSTEYANPMMRVAALDESIKLATRAGRASLMVDLIDELGNSVEIDAGKMKLEGFQEISRRLPKGADAREIAGTFYEFTRSSEAQGANPVRLQKLKITMLEFAFQNGMIDLKRLISQSME